MKKIVTCRSCRRTTEAKIIKREVAQRNENKDVKAVILVSTNIRTCGACNSTNIRTATLDEIAQFQPVGKTEGLAVFGFRV